MDNQNINIEILQFGTGRLLQALVDFFLDQAKKEGQKIGKVVALQSSSQPAGRKRAQAFNSSSEYPVRIEGFHNNKTVNETHQISIIEKALVLSNPEEWSEAISLVKKDVRYIISNTADRGYQLFDEDHKEMKPPKSFPAKLLLLLNERYNFNKIPITILPCELINGNADILRDTVVQLANKWSMSKDMIQWIEKDCIWANTLVDRIVSESLDPIGAVAEPYSLWAIQKKPGFDPPCIHPSVKVVDDLYPFELLKLGILNLSHTFLVDLWLKNGKPDRLKLVIEIIKDHEYLELLNQVLNNEVIPTIKALIPDEDPEAYMESVLDRFRNPFLKHELSAIADNHLEKVKRRLLMVREHSHRLFPDRATPLLDSCLIRNNFEISK